MKRKERNLKLSLKERKLLYLLRLNARMPISEIATRIGCSRELTQYTLKTLIERKKVIEKFFVEVDYNRLGYVVYYIFIRLKNNSLDETRKIIKSVIELDDICWAGTFFGRYNIALGVISKNIYCFDELFSKIKQLVKNNIIECCPIRMLEIKRFPIKFLLNKKEEESLRILAKHVKGKKDLYYISNEEKIILNELIKNPRIRLIELVEKTTFSYKKIKDLLQKLSNEGIVKGFMTSFRFSRLRFAELNTFDILVKFNEDERHNKRIFEEFLKNHKHISSLIKFTGGFYDYLFWIYAPHINEARKILDEMTNLFPNNLESNELLIFGIEEEHYWDYSKVLKL